MEDMMRDAAEIRKDLMDPSLSPESRAALKVELAQALASGSSRELAPSAGTDVEKSQAKSKPSPDTEAGPVDRGAWRTVGNKPQAQIGPGMPELGWDSYTDVDADLKKVGPAPTPAMPSPKELTKSIPLKGAGAKAAIKDTAEAAIESVSNTKTSSPGARIALGVVGTGIMAANQLIGEGEPEPEEKPYINRPKTQAPPPPPGVESDKVPDTDVNNIEQILKLISDPAAFDKRMKELDGVASSLKSSMDSIAKKKFDGENKALAELAAANTELERNLVNAYSAYQAEKSATKSAQMWESIIHGITLLAAGIYGNKTGVNLGGLELKPSDWKAQYDSMKDELGALQISARDLYSGKKDTANVLDRDFRDARDEFYDNQKLQMEGKKALLQDIKSSRDTLVDIARQHADVDKTSIKEAGDNKRAQIKADKEVPWDEKLRRKVEERRSIKEVDSQFSKGGKGDDKLDKLITNFATSDKSKAVALLPLIGMEMQSKGVPQSEVDKFVESYYSGIDGADEAIAYYASSILPSLNKGATPASSPKKVEVKRQYSPSANKTKIIYNDGSEEVINGK